MTYTIIIANMGGNLKMKKIKQIKTPVFLLAVLLVLNCVFMVSQNAQAAARLNHTSAVLWTGDSLQLSIQNNNKKVKWSSNKVSVATVSSKGKVKAKNSGKTVITAKTGGKEYNCKITVKKTEISSKNITLVYGNNAKLTLKNPKSRVAWFSSNKKIVFADGKNVYARSVGEAVITAKCSGKSYVCNINVTSGETDKIVENGKYTSKEKVASYIHEYNKLPDNFITKKEAKLLGWNGGSLLNYASDKCIGGDIYSNYEKSLPVKYGRVYYECDINTLGALERGAERIIYSNDGLIFYTADHYATFEKLY